MTNIFQTFLSGRKEFLQNLRSSAAQTLPNGLVKLIQQAIGHVACLCLLLLPQKTLAQSFTFNYTGSVQTYTVPPGVTSLHIVAYGAAAIYKYANANLGGKVEADLAVTPGQVLNIYVGGTSGWNGGVVQSVPYGISSGDATDIRIGGTALANRVLVAGGGGSRGGSTPIYASSPLVFLEFNVEGAAGGGLTADNGADNTVAAIVQGNPPVLLASGGKGGTSTAGGAGGSPSGVAGQLGKGGSLFPLNMTCGSGGGGYYGGGSGGWNGSTTGPNGGGGGGGSSYTSSACTNVIHTKGASRGWESEGLVVITPYCPTGSQPDIVLTGNTIDILNNDLTASTDDNTDLGTAVQAIGSTTKNFVIKNTGTVALSVSSVSVSGDATFSLDSPPSFPLTIAAGGSQTIAVKFTPTALGTKSATLVIENSDCDESIYKVSLKATGVCATDIRVKGNDVEVPYQSLTPQQNNNTDFGEIAVNTSITKTFVIRNAGTGASLTVSSILFQYENGDNSPDFSLVAPPTFPLSIPPGGSQTITVRCSPTTIGAKRAYIFIANNHCTAKNFYSYLGANSVCPANTPEINVQGNGTTILEGDSSPSTADNTDFGDVNAGSPSDKTFVIQNLGNANLSISGISTSQIYYSTEFTLVNPPTFPLNIAAGGSQTITVRFQTSQQGSASSKLIIYSNDCDEGEYDIALQGNAVVTPATGLNFDGDGDYVEIQDRGLASAITSSSGITIEYWFKGSNAQSGVRIQSGNDYIVMGWNNNKHIISSSGGSDGGVSMGAAATNGHWHHIAMTWEVANGFGTFSSYLDGSLIDQRYGSDFALPSLNYSSVYLGGLASDESMNGTLDKLRIWNVARTESDIKDNMSCDLSPQPGLLASYNFDQGFVGQDNYFNQMLFDDSGNSYGGILSNFALTGNVSNWVEGYSATPSVTIASNDADNSIASGTSVTFTATPTNGGTTPSYQWKKNDVSVGTNSATYTTTTLVSGDKIQVEMTSSNACASPTTATSNVITMTVTTNVCVNPAVYTVTGGGSYCAGGTGVPVGLSNSESGVSYQLKKDNVNIGSPIEGSGTSISFGNKTGSGVYTVVATRTVGGCSSTMTGSVSVNITPSVTPSVVIAANPSGSITTGTSVTFTATPTNGGSAPTYVWKKNDVTISNETGATYTTTTLANGDKIKVEMTSNATCASPATATSSETTMSVTTPCTNPTAYTVTGGGSYCSGGTGVAVGLSSSESGVTYQLKKDNVDEGASVGGTTGMSISFGNKTGSGVYTVVATRTLGGCSSTMTGSVSVTITSLVTPSVVIGANPSGSITTGTSVTFTATPTNGGSAPTYVWKKNDVTIPNETGATYTTTTLANGDKIKVEMTSNATCASPATATSSETTMSVTTPCTNPTAYTVTGGGSYCSGGTGVAVGLSSSESGVTYQLKKDNVDEGASVGGTTGTSISFGNKTAAGVYTVVATRTVGGCSSTMTGSVSVTITSLVTPSVVIGANPSGSITTGTSVTFTATPTNGGSAPTYVWKKNDVTISNETGATYTTTTLANGDKIKVEMTSNATCVSPATATGNEIAMVVCSLPTAYTVTGGGSYCAGGTGVAVGLSNSQVGVNYQLKKDGSNVGSVVAGTGSAISFGAQTNAGTYTIEATTAMGSCVASMSGNAVVSVVNLPTVYTVTGGGPYCSGSSGSVVGLSNSQAGVNYQLKKDGSNVGSVVAGTGSAISFGAQTNAGTYTVEATTATGSCVASMSGNAVVTVNPLPSLVSVTGGGSFCLGGVGVLVGLSGSEVSISYQLKKGEVAMGNALNGTGSALSFGNQTSVGTYTVVATNTATNCTASMTGSASVTTYALPTAVVSGTVSVCKGGSAAIVTFTGSNGVAPYTFSYQVNGGDVQKVTTAVGSTTATVSQSTSVHGIYTYTLVSVSDANCSQTQNGNALVTVQTKPVITLTTQQQTLNEGNNQTFCDTDANPVNSLQFNVSSGCVVGSPVWRVQVGSGVWSDWTTNSPVSQLSNNQPHRYQAACDATCPSTYTNPIELTINYRASVPQNVSLLVDRVTVAAGETKEVCSVFNTALTFNAACGANEVTLYSVDGSEYSSVVPTSLVDNQFHNYRVRCRKSDGTPSCVESESGVMRLKLASIPSAPTVALSTTASCDATASFSGQSSCGSLRTVWYNAATNVALPNLPTTLPSATTSYYARCQTENGCVSEKSNVVTFTLTSTQLAPVITASQEVVCTGTTVRISANCPAGSTTSWNTGVTTPSFEVAFNNVTKQTYWAKCIFEGGCQSGESVRKDIYWNAFVVTLINVGQSKSVVKSANDKTLWTSQFIVRDGGPELEQSTQVNPTLYYVENANKVAPRYWTINVDACVLGTDGSLTFDLLATPETGVPQSFNTHENNAPYFMYANREGWTELYAQNHPAYGFYQDNGTGGNVYDAGLPKGLYKLGIRYWDMKGWGSIYPSTRKPQGNVLAYQEYWFRIQSKNGVGAGAARTVEIGEEVMKGEGQNASTFATVVPNPVSKVLRLKIQANKGNVVQTTLTDASGRRVLSRQFVPETNTHQEEFEVGELPTGMYFLKVNAGDKQATLKVVKVD